MDNGAEMSFAKEVIKRETKTTRHFPWASGIWELLVLRASSNSNCFHTAIAINNYLGQDQLCKITTIITHHNTQGTDESTLVTGLSALLMYNDPCENGALILTRITQRNTCLKFKIQISIYINKNDNNKLLTCEYSNTRLRGLFAGRLWMERDTWQLKFGDGSSRSVTAALLSVTGFTLPCREE